jgi:hypothetical protein
LDQVQKKKSKKNRSSIFNIFLQEKAQALKQKEGKREKPNPRKRKACHSIGTALLQSVAEIGTQSTMKSNKNMLHEFTSHCIPQKTPMKKNIISSTNEMLQTDITVRAQRTRVSSTHARVVTNYHQISQAINQLKRYRRQPVNRPPSSRAKR